MTRVKNDEYASISVIPKALSAKAVLVKLHPSNREVWVPQSQVFEDDLAEIEIGVQMEMNIKQWFVDKEGLDE